MTFIQSPKAASFTADPPHTASSHSLQSMTWEAIVGRRVVPFFFLDTQTGVVANLAEQHLALIV